MRSHQAFIRIATILLFFHFGESRAALFGSSTEEDCVLDAMKAARADNAAQIARKACSEKYDRLELQNRRELLPEEISHLSATASLASTIPIALITPQVQREISDGSYGRKHGFNELKLTIANDNADLTVRSLVVTVSVDSEVVGEYVSACRIRPSKTEVVSIAIKAIPHDAQWSYTFKSAQGAPVGF